MAYVVERAVAAVQAEQQGSNALAVFGDAVSADDGVHGAEVLDLGPASFAGLICAGGILGNDAVESGALVAGEPGGRFVRVGGLRRDTDDWAALDCFQQTGAPLLERSIA